MPLIKLYLKNTEKDFRDLFVDFRDKKITLYQVRARMLEKSRGLIYKTVDDMKTQLNKPEFFENLEEVEALLKNMASYGEEGDMMEILLNPDSLWKRKKRCLKSLFSVFVKPPPKKRPTRQVVKPIEVRSVRVRT